MCNESKKFGQFLLSVLDADIKWINVLRHIILKMHGFKNSTKLPSLLSDFNFHIERFLEEDSRPCTVH